MYITCKLNGERNENEAKAAAARTDISLFRDINGGNWFSLSRLLSPMIDREVSSLSQFASTEKPSNQPQLANQKAVFTEAFAPIFGLDIKTSRYQGS